jgi:hypothetical protein
MEEVVLMHRVTARTLAVVSLAGMLAAGSLPAAAGSPHPERRGGKKPVGEVVSYDAASSVLVVELASGEEMSAVVDPDVQVKLEHRGRAKPKDSKEHGNPTRGSLDDLVPGAGVLRLKLEDEVVTKIRLRPAPPPVETPVPAVSDDTDDSDGVDEDEAGEADSEDDEDPDEDESGDPEDALPPLPAP